MTKILMIIISLIFILFYMQIKDLRSDSTAMKKDINHIVSMISLLKDRLDIKDREIEERNMQIAKYNANYDAFNGTACMQCHLDSNHLLPYSGKELMGLDDYIRVVRNGIGNVMPSYINSPNKTSKDITDSELRRQYKILKNFTDKVKIQ
ncbi:hypothetical protein [Helicobacter trogontum]|uniref:Cytochrome c domain-containing protein n=1 Tax=Helicobacter trogontum TaxID=50960 RepID=A0A4V6HZE8_9HELI|nr:hypothetical protein [Helicobacter trogontum]TLD84262.1 hypothetical protein LS81_002005 [Helicobacter trogontum]